MANAERTVYRHTEEESADIIIDDRGDDIRPIYPDDPDPHTTIHVYYYTVLVQDSSNNPIGGASVKFKNGSTTLATKTTKSSGIAQYTAQGRSNPYGVLTLDISCTGYTPNNNVSIYPSTDNYTSYTTLYVTLSGQTNLYVINVVDIQGNYINDALVKVYERSDSTSAIRTINKAFHGQYVYQSQDNTTYYFEASKNGYNPIIQSRVAVQVGDHNKTITLEPIPKYYYYYTIAVKDNIEQPVKNAKVRTYSISGQPIGLGYDNVPANVPEAYDDVFDNIKQIVADIEGKDVSLINGSTPISSNELAIKSEVESQYAIVISNEDFEDLTNVTELTRYVNQNSNVTVNRTYFSTDDNGLVAICMGQYEYNPGGNITIKCVEPPVGYSWIEPTSGMCSPTRSETVPSITFHAHNNGLTTYYYYYKFIDNNTGQPISGVNVTYFDEDLNINVTRTSNEYGCTIFSSYYTDLYFSASKSEYQSIDKKMCPENTEEQYMSQILIPKNSIHIEYSTDSGASEPGASEPVESLENRYIKIYQIGTDYKPYTLGIYTTYENGYIDTLKNEWFSVDHMIYATVLNYTVSNPSDEVLLTINLALGGNKTITLPKGKWVGEDDEFDENNSFEPFSGVSASSIKKNISIGNQEMNDGLSARIEYISDKDDTKDNKYATDDFRINIIEPDSITTYDIFTNQPIIMTNDSQKNVIGSIDMCLKPNVNDLRLKTINRYSGYYNPIFKDILFYKNLKDCPFSNTEFDTEYSDNYGQFGVINNMWFHKVNDTGVEIINSLTPYYPLTGQYALDHRDYSIFESNWDLNHYTRQINVDNSESCKNMMSMKDGLCMFGSKYLNVPESIEICGFTLGDDFNDKFTKNYYSTTDDWKNNLNWSGEWNDDWITCPDACPGEVMFKEINDNSVNFYLFIKKRILRYFRNKLKSEFESYISPNFSFGKMGVDDDIDEYVVKNVLKLYKLEKVRVFVRRTKVGQHNSKIENDYTRYLEYIPVIYNGSNAIAALDEKYLGYFKSHGFVEVNNITLTKMNRDDFDRKLTYNLRSGYKEDFGFSFILKKI